MPLRIAALLVAITVFLASACHYMGPAVRVYGSPRDLEALVGQWSGEYVGDLFHGRGGSIFFALTAGEQHAHGDVLMTPERGAPYVRYHEEDEAIRGSRFAHDEVLTIQFVTAQDGRVTGRLDPYWDPERNAEAVTVFTGQLDGDRIEGTFTASYSRGIPSTSGRWTVRRIRRTS
jgi:hypothetical protein